MVRYHWAERIVLNKKMVKISKYTSYFKSISQYFGASLIPMFLSLAVNPLIALNMSPDDYAISGYYTSFSTLFSPLIVFYMLHYYTKRFFEVSEEERDLLRAMLVKSLIYFSGVISIFCFIGLLIYSKIFNSDSTIPFSPYAFLAIFSLPLTGTYSLMLTDLRMRRESGKFFNYSVLLGVITFIFNLLFIVFFKWGAFGKLLVPFVSNLIFFLASCYYYRHLFHIPIESSQLTEMVRFCFPLTIAAMLGFFSNGYDRVFLERLGNDTELGYYSVGVQMATYITVFQNAIGSTFQPDMFQAIANRDKQKLVKVIFLLLGSVSFLVLVYIIAAPLMVRILTAGRYMLSVKYTQIIALSALTSAMYYTVSQITIALGKSSITLITKIVTTILSIIMFSVLISKYEFIGASWGLVLSFVVSLVVNLVLIVLFKKIKK